MRTENSSEPNERALAGNKKGKTEKSVTKRCEEEEEEEISSLTTDVSSRVVAPIRTIRSARRPITQTSRSSEVT